MGAGMEDVHGSEISLGLDLRTAMAWGASEWAGAARGLCVRRQGGGGRHLITWPYLVMKRNASRDNIPARPVTSRTTRLFIHFGTAVLNY
jgi:hypothetical protein